MIIKNMSTTIVQEKEDNQKEDLVLSYAKNYADSHPGSHVARLFIYADPSASGLDHNKPETYMSLKTRCMDMNAVPVERAAYDYVGTEKSIRSVTIPVRIRHVISQHLVLRNMLELVRLVHHVKNAKGEEWPVDSTGNKLKSDRFPTFKLTLLKSLLSQITKGLVQELPTFIDEVYKAKYKNGTTFPYSVALTKLYTIKNMFLYESFMWIGISIDEMRGRAGDRAILVDPTGKVTRSSLAWEEWYYYAFNPKDQKHKFAETYDKLASSICARIGKLKYEQPGKDENPETFARQKVACEALMDKLEFNRLPFFDKKKDAEGREIIPDVTGMPDTKKKFFQTKLYEHLLYVLQSSHKIAAQQLNVTIPKDDKVHLPDQYKEIVMKNVNHTLEIISQFADAIALERSLVYLDMYDDLKVRKFFTRDDFDTIARYFTQTGVANDRVVNAITKFISCSSQRYSSVSRKVIPPSIENAIVSDAKILTKIKMTNVTDPAIIFSSDAIQTLMKQGEIGKNVAFKFSGLVDKTNPGLTGYLQRGVMALTSALKEDSNSFTIPPGMSTVYSNGRTYTVEDQLRYYANQFDEMANLFQMLIDPAIVQRKKEMAAITKMNKMYYNAYGEIPKQNQGASSPHQAYIPGAISPSQGTASIFPQTIAAAVPFVPSSAAVEPTIHHHTNHHNIAVESMAPPPVSVQQPASPNTHIQHQAFPEPANFFGGSTSSRSASPKSSSSTGVFGNIASPSSTQHNFIASNGLPEVNQVASPSAAFFPGTTGGATSPMTKSSSLFPTSGGASPRQSPPAGFLPTAGVISPMAQSSNLFPTGSVSPRQSTDKSFPVAESSVFDESGSGF